jgi:hypothetical protein
MNPNLRGVWEHMRELGLAALSHACYHAHLRSPDNSSWWELSLVQAAHAGELLIKARIAQEHPLLIFEQLPRSPQATSSLLELEDLFRKGRTITWSELPDRLWATTGIVLPAVERFREFGELRNCVQHFAVPSKVPTDALQFIFEVLDPFLNDCWGLFAIDYNEDYEPYVYLAGALVGREIMFRVSREAAACAEHWDVDWKSVKPAYATEMKRRIAAALIS